MKAFLVALSVVVTGALGGCGASTSTAGGSSPSASPAPSLKAPGDVLAAAVPSAARGTYQFSLKEQDDTVSGVSDPAGKKYQVTVDAPVDTGVSFHMEFVSVLPELWVKMSFPGASQAVAARLPKLPSGWMHVDKSKVTGSFGQAFDQPDVTDFSSFSTATAGVVSTGTNAFSGTVDLTKATGQTTFDADTVKALGDTAKALPFSATVDDKGRILTFTLPVPAVGKTAAYTYTATFSDYGAAPAVAAPTAAEITEAPAAAYTLLNGDGS